MMNYRRNSFMLCCLLTLIVFAAGLTRAADWPQWRCDARRSAVFPEHLPDGLELRWTRKLSLPAAAWPASQKKLRFDEAPQPVAAGNLLFVPSSRTDSVTAYAAATGAEVWVFHAGGPVRFAPAFSGGRLYFVSDDGFLYCLDAGSGKLDWKFRGGADDRLVLGNDRMISAWPARGAPVIDDGTVYFTAGTWPFMGIFIHALDAKTGRVKWTNSGSGAMYMNQQHNSPAFAGVAPQGYLVSAGKILLVAGGRTVPAAYSAEDGRFLYFNVSSRKFGKDAGGYNIAAAGGLFFNNGAAYKLEDGKPAERAGWGVFTDTKAYCLENSRIAVRSLPSLREDFQISMEQPLHHLFLSAGGVLYGARDDGSLLAYRLEGRSAKLAWSKKIKGAPRGMIAAGERLFIVTAEGMLYCFGPRGTKKNWDFSAGREPGRSAASGRYGKILKQAPPGNAGYCLLAGLGSGKLLEALYVGTDYRIIAVDPDEKKVARFREKFYRLDAAAAAGGEKNTAYGPPPPRVQIIHADPFELPWPPYFADFVVSDDLKAAGFRSGKNPSRLLDAVRPYGGVAYLSLEISASAFLSAAKRAKVDGIKLEKKRTVVIARRPGALPGAGSWTHQYADAANTVISRDTRVHLPLGLLWFGGPPNDPILPRHGHGPSPQVTGGRLFIEGRHLLRAVDVYTGRLLWETHIDDLGKYYDITRHFPGANEIGSNYVSVKDAVYAVTPDKCLLLDPLDGKIVKRFDIPGGGATPKKWGNIRVLDDLLIATAVPVLIPVGEDKGKDRKSSEQPADMTPVIKQGERWKYLAGKDPTGNWTKQGFNDSLWKTGTAGFGYGDNDDSTVLSGMRNHYTRVYVRKSFTALNPGDYEKLALMVNYDDAFVAYLNGVEIVRAGVGRGSGAKARGIDGHEADGFVKYDIAPGLLKKGENLLALEGHNTDSGSSDFSLDPYLLGKKKGGNKKSPQEKTGLASVPGVKVNTSYSSGSLEIVVLDRHSGKLLWRRAAEDNFRHNAIAAGDGKVFCIDGLSPEKRAFLQRRGIEPKSGVLYALDAGAGRVLWKISKDVFGTWLGFSAEHGVVLEAGSRGRDRAVDEIGRGMAVYRARDGKLLWKNNDDFEGPCLLHKDWIIAQNKAYNLMTGKRIERTNPLTGQKQPWFYRRNYGCNTVIGSDSLLTFRSAAAGYFDLENDGGTGNLGGFKSGCTSNLIIADGVLNAPDYTHTCTCSYQNQCSIAFVYSPDAELWTFNELAVNGRITRLGINFGAPGDRRAENGSLWVDYPSFGGPSPKVDISIEPKTSEGLFATGRAFRFHSSASAGGPLPWVASSGLIGARVVRVNLGGSGKYTVRLVFAEPFFDKPATRVFSVSVQGKKVVSKMDPVKAAKGKLIGSVKEVKHVSVNGTLTVELSPAGRAGDAEPVISGLEIIAE